MTNPISMSVNGKAVKASVDSRTLLVQYLREHHDRIVVLHLKDRKKNQGPNTPWGEGETPIKEVLQMLKREKWPIRALVEYEYRGTADSVTEVKKCVAYAKAALA